MNLTKPYHCLVAGLEFCLDSKAHVLSSVLQLWRKWCLRLNFRAIFTLQMKMNHYKEYKKQSRICKACHRTHPGFSLVSGWFTNITPSLQSGIMALGSTGPSHSIMPSLNSENHKITHSVSFLKWKIIYHK